MDAHERPVRSTTGGDRRVADVLGNGHQRAEIPDVVLARTTDRVGAAIDLLQLYGISQMPVSEAPEATRSRRSSASISEQGLLDRAYRDPAVVERTVGEVMDRPLPIVDAPAPRRGFALLSAARRRWSRSATGAPVGVVTKLDLLEYLAPSRLAVARPAPTR